MVVEAGNRDEPSTSEAVDSAEIDAIVESLEALERKGKELDKALQSLHALQDEFEKEVKSISKSTRSLPKDYSRANEFRNRLSSFRPLTPAPGGPFVELFLGSINVRFVRKTERLAFKAEYERLKQRLAPMFVALCIGCLVLEEYRWLHMILQLALTTYYATLAIRENILRVNGSNIKPWWVLHHYLTMMQGVLLLTWPNNATYASFRTRLHYYGLYNAVLQIFQTRYQMARLYALRSLGKAGEMDVASSDSTQIHWSESMRTLLPLILFGQLIQAFLAVVLLRLYLEFPNELQVLLLAILFAANFVGNITTTSVVVLEKHKSSRRPQNAPSSSAATAVDTPLTASDGASASATATQTELNQPDRSDHVPVASTASACDDAATDGAVSQSEASREEPSITKKEQ